ncbi:MAG: helicase HerA-like domain-containing protein [Hyphomicrobiaceae bacterium]
MTSAEAKLEQGLIFIGQSDPDQGGGPECLELRLANRHGLITGATGTGKTVTLQVLAEGFSAAGVPVFAADIKGDLSGISMPGEPKPFLTKRAEEIGLEDYTNAAFPTVFWDIFGQQGHPVRATVQEMGPLLLARLLELNEVQEGVLNIMFRVAADERMPLLDLRDLRAMVAEVAGRAKEMTTKYGNVSPTSAGAIQRRLLVLEEQGANHFFGEPALDIKDFIRTARDGRGIVNLLVADRLMNTPRLYATFLLWMLSRLFDELPEVGDPEKPKLVFFFDEAHLLFNDAPKALLEQIERVTRLIRSKGVGVYYVTQNPRDVPNAVSAQLGNRIQHALRAFTPIEQRGIRAAAETFRPNPAIDVERVIQELKVGEALVSVLHNKGEPSMVQRTMIRPPAGRIGPITPAERQKLIDTSPIQGKYEDLIDRESAHELLQKKAEAAAAEAEKAQQAESGGWAGSLGKTIFGRGPRGGMSMGEQITRDVSRSIMRSIVTQVKNAIIKSIFGGKRR